MKILYKFPSRERPYKFFAAVDNIIAMARHDNYSILATLDIDDPTMTTEEVKTKLHSYGDKVKAVFGFSGCKVAAINRDLYLMDDDVDILVLHSDDFWINEPGFDLDIIEAYSDGFRGLVHFPDGHVNERMTTYPIMHIEYYNRFGYIYFPGYNSVYCDNEQHDVSKLLGKYKFVDKKRITHRHHIWGYGPKDALLEKTEHPINYAFDGQTYQKRKAINFELEISGV